MTSSSAASRLAACGLPESWAGCSAWTVLDTAYDDGNGFLDTWLAWRHDPNRPRLLHYVGITGAANTTPDLAAASASDPERLQLAQNLFAQCKHLGAGFQRITLEDGRLSLTLCRGDVTAMLGEQTFRADTLFAAYPFDKWAVQMLARRCKRGTQFWMLGPANDAGKAKPSPPVAPWLQGAGFRLDATDAQAGSLTGRFDPNWNIPTGRTPQAAVRHAPGRCAVIGAGMAGASIAHTLALRGWQVTVLDQEAQPAGGASGLPAGLAVPHISVDDSPRSRLSRSGIHLLRQQAERLLTLGQDWAPSGVLERRPDCTQRWHPEAAWVKPAAWVRALLHQPGIRFCGNTRIVSLQYENEEWTLRDTQDQDQGPFDLLVVACAMGSEALIRALPARFAPEPELMAKLAALQAVHGTLSHGRYAEEIPGIPSTPVNGNGCFIPHVPAETGEQWCAGSTYETDASAAADTWAQHAVNMEKLQHLLPPDGQTLADTLDRGPVFQWTATRCVTHDRLPLVGPVNDHGVWLCTGMGSRGLSFAALCAELLIARLGGEPLPVEFSLSRSLDVNRVRRKRSAQSEPSARPFAASPAPGVD